MASLRVKRRVFACVASASRLAPARIAIANEKTKSARVAVPSTDSPGTRITAQRSGVALPSPISRNAPARIAIAWTPGRLLCATTAARAKASTASPVKISSLIVTRGTSWKSVTNSPTSARKAVMPESENGSAPTRGEHAVMTVMGRTYTPAITKPSPTPRTSQKSRRAG